MHRKLQPITRHRTIHAINRSASTNATPETVYAMLLDRATWPTWSPLDAFEHESDGIDGPNSLGAIGTFVTGRTRSREELIELVPRQRLAYRLLSGLPLRNYTATVDIDVEGGRTTILWRSTFVAPFGTGWAFRFGLGRFIARTVEGLAHAAHAADAAVAARIDIPETIGQRSDSPLGAMS